MCEVDICIARGISSKTTGPFPGAQLLAEVERELSKAQSTTVTKVLPRRTAADPDAEDEIDRYFRTFMAMVGRMSLST